MKKKVHYVDNQISNRHNVDSPFPRKLTVLLLFLQYKLGTAKPIHQFRLNLPNNKSHGAGSKGQDLLNFLINQLSVTMIGENSKNSALRRSDLIILNCASFKLTTSNAGESTSCLGANFLVPGLPNVCLSENIDDSRLLKNH